MSFSTKSNNDTRETTATPQQTKKTDEWKPLGNHTWQQNKCKSCYRCNGDDHTVKNYKYINYKCNKYKKTCHLQQTCKTKINYNLEENSPELDLDTVKGLDLYTVNDVCHVTTKKCAPFIVKLDNVPVQMKIDTEAAVSIMSNKKFYKSLQM
jgi:hypothetical protein